MPAYSVRCVIRWKPRQGQVLRHLYEERITIWQAQDFETAIALAERESADYASEGDEALGLAQAYELADEAHLHGVEVFSLLRESDLEPEEYLTAFFETGHERSSTSQIE
jgi:hypothetical protein